MNLEVRDTPCLSYSCGSPPPFSSSFSLMVGPLPLYIFSGYLVKSLCHFDVYSMGSNFQKTREFLNSSTGVRISSTGASQNAVVGIKNLVKL